MSEKNLPESRGVRRFIIKLRARWYARKVRRWLATLEEAEYETPGTMEGER